jgi:hypothetical protein
LTIWIKVSVGILEKIFTEKRIAKQIKLRVFMFKIVNEK